MFFMGGQINDHKVLLLLWLSAKQFVLRLCECRLVNYANRHPFLFFCEKIPSQWATVSSGGSPQYRPQRTPSEVDNKKRTLSWEPSTKWFHQEILFNLSKPTNYLFLYPGWSSSFSPSPVIIPTNHPIVPRTLLKHRPISPGAMKWTDPVSFTDTDTTRYLFRPVWSSSDLLLQSTFCHCPVAFWCHPGSFRHNIHSSGPGALKGSHSIPHSFAALYLRRSLIYCTGNPLYSTCTRVQCGRIWSGGIDRVWRPQLDVF